MHRLPIALAAAALSAGLASAQSFNLDVGDNLILWPTPPASYGAGAGQSGHWNDVKTPYSHTLAGLDGLPSSVQVASNLPYSYNDPFTALPPDDEAFMADVQAIDPLSAPAVWSFSGLQAGTYEVYTYAWAPSGSGAQSSVAVVGSSAAQIVGGSWAGSPHVLGITYAKHLVAVDDGILEVRVDATGGVLGPGASVNGFQLVRLGDGPGTRYCESTPNSTGAAALLQATGTASLAQNDLVLAAGPVPNQPGIFFYGTLQTQLAFGNGFLCVVGQIHRLPVTPASGNELRFEVDYGALPPGGAITAGSSWNFQAWFRDPAAGGAAFDLSDASSIPFVP